MAGLQIFIRYKNIITLDVEASDSIENVRQKIQDRTGVVPDKMILKFRNVILTDGQTLSDYGITEGDFLRLYIKENGSDIIIIIFIINIVLFILFVRFILFPEKMQILSDQTIY
jgi:uncharacterized ubiquitin-like protein YukD